MDDNPHQLRSLADLVTPFARADLADSFAAGERALQERGPQYAFCIFDVRLDNGRRGTELRDLAMAAGLDTLPVIIATAYSEENLRELAGGWTNVTQVLYKGATTFSSDAVAIAVEQALGTRERLLALQGATRQLAEQEAFVRLGEQIAVIAHDIGNRVAAPKAYVDTCWRIVEGLRDPRMRAQLSAYLRMLDVSIGSGFYDLLVDPFRDLSAAIGHLAEMADLLKRFGRGEFDTVRVRDRVTVATLVAELAAAAEQRRQAMLAAQVVVEATAPPGDELACDRVQLWRILENLLKNALEEACRGGLDLRIEWAADGLLTHWPGQKPELLPATWVADCQTTDWIPELLARARWQPGQLSLVSTSLTAGGPTEFEMAGLAASLAECRLPVAGDWTLEVTSPPRLEVDRTPGGVVVAPLPPRVDLAVNEVAQGLRQERWRASYQPATVQVAHLQALLRAALDGLRNLSELPLNNRPRGLRLDLRWPREALRERSLAAADLLGWRSPLTALFRRALATGAAHVALTATRLTPVQAAALADLAPPMEDPEPLLLAVHNSGQSIAPELLPHLFTPLAARSAARKLGVLKADSSGMGLPAAARLTRAHGGRLFVTVPRDEGGTAVLGSVEAPVQVGRVADGVGTVFGVLLPPAALAARLDEVASSLAPGGAQNADINDR